MADNCRFIRYILVSDVHRRRCQRRPWLHIDPWHRVVVWGVPDRFDVRLVRDLRVVLISAHRRRKHLVLSVQSLHVNVRIVVLDILLAIRHICHLLTLRWYWGPRIFNNRLVCRVHGTHLLLLDLMSIISQWRSYFVLLWKLRFLIELEWLTIALRNWWTLIHLYWLF